MELEGNIVDQMQQIGLVDSSQNRVNALQDLVEPVATKNQQGPTKNQQGPTNSQFLSELGQQAKAELEILVATGKSKDLTGKILTYNDLDCMSEKELLRYYRIYQSTIASRVNDSFSKIAVKSYCTLANWLLPIDDQSKLYDDLRNDYILNSELDRWIGWLCLKMGPLTALASSSLITFNNCNFSEIEVTRNEEKSSKINEQ